VSTEVATLARALGEAAGLEVVGIVVGADPAAAAEELARYLPRVITVKEPATADHVAGVVVAQRVAELAKRDEPAWILTGASPEGRDLAAILGALLEWPILLNAVAVEWSSDGPRVDESVFGGKLITTSGFSAKHGIVTVRPNVVEAAAAAKPGVVEVFAPSAEMTLPSVTVVGRAEEASAAVPIEEARIIVAGGRGVGGEDGFRIVEELAAALGGAVGATRAAVDAGWIPYAQQIGQTGKIVKPQLYLALGISGAIQHKVGMQTASTIVAINRDPDAPIAEFADMVVVGDLFDVVPAILTELRARSG
jgi:electron transfer flavoprotein alpha subunit